MPDITSQLILYSLPAISAIIGWLTNILAIKSLFHPKHPLSILGITFHGVFPKRQNKIASSLGELIAEELLSEEAIQKQLEDTDKQQAMIRFLQEHIETFIDNNAQTEKKNIASRITHSLLIANKEQLAHSLAKRLPAALNTIVQSEHFRQAVKATIYEKVASFSSDELEVLLNRLIKKELKSIEILGAIIGFIVGLLQLALVLLSQP